MVPQLASAMVPYMCYSMMWYTSSSPCGYAKAAVDTNEDYIYIYWISPLVTKGMLNGTPLVPQSAR